MKLSGSEIIIECLKKEGVEFIFGYPGGAVLHIYDALFEIISTKLIHFFCIICSPSVITVICQPHWFQSVTKIVDLPPDF